MAQIYEKNLWGGERFDFYSGSGSHHPDLVDPYVEVVSEFLQSFDEPLRVVDLGCGDFNVGRKLVTFTKSYEAVDIVPELIERNRKTFQADRLTFHCLDIASEEWPDGDCVILRNVLQHLSNAEISSIVNKLPCYDYLIVTEHIPEGEFTPNADIISGQGIRLKKGSGVDLTAPPFEFRAKHSEQWLSLPAKDASGLVVTTCFTR
jgi:SAM-dependent methyltransferase